MVVLARIQQGNLSNVKGSGRGCWSTGLTFGPGHQVNSGRDGDVLLLAGETKKQQHPDIDVDGSDT